MAKRVQKLTVSGRQIPNAPAWIMQESFLLEAGVSSLKTEITYRSSLRLFADWLQHFNKLKYDVEMEWPLSPEHLDTATILEFRNWLIQNKAKSTVTTYMAAVIGYLHYLDGMDNLPDGIQLGKLQRQMSRRKIERGQAETVIDLDLQRQSIPKIVGYYNELPLPAENDRYNRRLSLLRDRAVVTVLYSTAARISEVVSLNRRNVDEGRADQAMIVGKGNKARVLHLQEYAKKSIQAYLRERKDSKQALFVSHSQNSKGARLSVTSVHNLVKKAVKALRLHESLSAHDFRHYRATQLLREGMPLEVVQEYLGHADISTTRSIYAPVLGTEIVSEWLRNMDVKPEDAVKENENEGEIVTSELNPSLLPPSLQVSQFLEKIDKPTE